MKRRMIALISCLLAPCLGQVQSAPADWPSVVHKSARIVTAIIERQSYVMKPDWKNLEHKASPDADAGRYKHKEIVEIHFPQQEAVGKLYQLQIVESLKGKDHASEINVYFDGRPATTDSPYPALKERETYVFFLVPLSPDPAKNLKNMQVLTGNTVSPFEPDTTYTLVDYKVLEMNSPSPTVDEIRALASQKN